MSDSQGGGWDGNIAIDEYFLAGIEQYRAHLELLYPFSAVWILSLFLETRIEFIELVFDFENNRFVVDREFLEAILSDHAVDQLTPVLDEIFLLLVVGVVVIALLVTLGLLVAVGIAFLVAADEHRERNRTQVARTRVALVRMPALFAASVIAGIAVVFGLVLLVVPGIYLATRFALAGPAIVIDGAGPIEGLRASWRAVSDQLWTVFGVLAVGTVVFLVVGVIPLLGEFLVILVVYPIFALALATLYVQREQQTDDSGEAVTTQ